MKLILLVIIATISVFAYEYFQRQIRMMTTIWFMTKPESYVSHWSKIVVYSIISILALLLAPIIYFEYNIIESVILLSLFIVYELGMHIIEHFEKTKPAEYSSFSYAINIAFPIILWAVLLLMQSITSGIIK